MLIKQIWLTPEFMESHGMDSQLPFTRMEILKYIRRVAGEEIGGVASLKWAHDVVMDNFQLKYTTPTEDINNDKKLFLHFDVIEGQNYYTVNPNFDWDSYNKTDLHFPSANATEELELLKRLARVVDKGYDVESGFYVTTKLSDKELDEIEKVLSILHKHTEVFTQS